MPTGHLPGIVNLGLVQEEDVVASPVPIGTVVADRYRVDRVIGSGGMGVVVQATHVVLQQPVAIKFLRREVMRCADAIERFVREARAAAKVQSDFVVRVQDIALLDDSTPYIVMEYVEGRDLGAELAERGPLPLREAVAYLVQTCEALIETHAAGIIHGDLKPENLYLARSSDGGRRVKLLDFGISRISVDPDERAGSLSAGTPAYMAPEQFRHGAADVRTDIWSLGSVLYELLSGAPPFGVDDVDAICRQASRAIVPPIARDDVPPDVNAVVARCMEKEPARRYCDVRELATALRPFLPPDASSERSIRAPTTEQTPAAVATVALQRTASTMVDPVRRARARRRALYAAMVGTATVAVLAMVAMVSVDRSKNANTKATLPATSVPPRGNVTIADGPGPTASAVPPPSATSTDHADIGELDAGGAHATSAVGAHVRRPPRPPAADPRRASDVPPAPTDRFGTRK